MDLKEIGVSMRYICEDNIRMDIIEICANMRNWVNLAPVRDYWRAFVTVTLHLWVPWSFFLKMHLNQKIPRESNIVYY